MNFLTEDFIVHIIFPDTTRNLEKYDLGLIGMFDLFVLHIIMLISLFMLYSKNKYTKKY